jgi:dolichyl-diphosphooligosaccharide---protein glycosyltransferase subunit DDOST/WBP1
MRPNLFNPTFRCSFALLKVVRAPLPKRLIVDRGYKLTFLNPKRNSSSPLKKYEERLYDHIVLFPQKLRSNSPSEAKLTTVALGSHLTPQLLVEFLNKGGNILFAASSSTSESLRNFARELDIDLPPRDSLLADHFTFHPSSPRNHTLLTLSSTNFPSLPAVENIFSPETLASTIVYRGAAHALGNGPFLLPLVKATGTSYVFDGKEDLDSVEEPYVAGGQAFLVSGFQARNNARVVITSSLDMFSDEYARQMELD